VLAGTPRGLAGAETRPRRQAVRRPHQRLKGKSMATTSASASRKAVLLSRATFVVIALGMAPTACSAAADTPEAPQNPATSVVQLETNESYWDRVDESEADENERGDNENEADENERGENENEADENERGENENEADESDDEADENEAEESE